MAIRVDNIRTQPNTVWALVLVNGSRVPQQICGYWQSFCVCFESNTKISELACILYVFNSRILFLKYFIEVTGHGTLGKVKNSCSFTDMLRSTIYTSPGLYKDFGNREGGVCSHAVGHLARTRAWVLFPASHTRSHGYWPPVTLPQTQKTWR